MPQCYVLKIHALLHNSLISIFLSLIIKLLEAQVTSTVLRPAGLIAHGFISILHMHEAKPNQNKYDSANHRYVATRWFVWTQNTSVCSLFG